MSRKSIYKEVAGKLEKFVSAMRENDFLPSEQELSEKFEVSKPTLRRALKEMVDMGKLRKINGVGVLVTKPPKEISRELIFLCHDIKFFTETINGFGKKTLESNYFASIVPLVGDVQTQERIILSIVERRPLGVVIYADPKNNNLSAFHQLGGSGIPSLYLMRLPYGIDSNLLEFGNSGGITEIIETFYNKGCRKIALYADMKINPAAAKERESGFKIGMKKCRLKIRSGYYCDYTASTMARENFLELFTHEKTRPDAVCCLNDYCAGSLIKELTKRQIDLNGILFSGFDHSPLSEFIPQPLLTANPPMEEMGKEAANMLIRQVENPNFAYQRKKLKSRLITTK